MFELKKYKERRGDERTGEENRIGERNKGRKKNSMFNQTMKMRFILFFTHFLSISFLFIPFPSYHFFQPKSSLVPVWYDLSNDHRCLFNLINFLKIK